MQHSRVTRCDPILIAVLAIVEIACRCTQVTEPYHEDWLPPREENTLATSIVNGKLKVSYKARINVETRYVHKPLALRPKSD